VNLHRELCLQEGKRNRCGSKILKSMINFE
jgi:hypothetical protein